MKRVLLTGGTGFLGQFCLRPLQQLGFEVHAVHYRSSARGPTGVIWHEADLLDREISQRLATQVRATHLLHLAWCTDPVRFWNSAENNDWRSASVALAEAFLSAGGERIVAAGSCAEYDWTAGVCSEQTTALRPNSIYGQQKVALCADLRDLCSRYGASLAWGRVFHLYGPGEHPSRLVAASVRAMLSGVPVNCTHGEQIRDYLFCADASEALVALLVSDVCGPVNIASGQPVKIRDLVHAAADATGRPDLVRLGAISAPENEPRLLIADVKRLTEDVRWQPRIGLAEGIGLCVSFWRSQCRAH